MRHSIRYKMSAVIVIEMLTAIVLGGTFGTVFVERFYSKTKQDAAINVYNQLRKLTDSDSDLTNSDSISQLNNKCESSGVTLIIVNSEGDTLYEYGAGRTLARRWQDMIFGPALGIEEKNTIIDSNDEYTLQATIDGFSEQKYYELFGTLDSGNYFVIRVSVESIKETLAITNKFYMGLCFGIMLIITFIILLITRNYTKPLLQLANISKQMSNLHFNVKYTGKHNDEIGILGNSMNELSSTLEKTISELKVANIELQKDIENKIEVDEMRKDFISNVSHELKTPIALIQGYAEGLQENISDDPESMEFYCHVIMDEADKMNKMVKKLLTLTQIEFGNKQVYIEHFNLLDLVKGVVNSSKLKAEQENVNIIFEQKDDVFVWADEFQIEEVITNYISNAFNHIDGKRNIEVKIVKKDDIVRLSVFNTGKLIPEDELENIWIKFYKIDKARTREYGGNGIGLSIVKAIADSMNKQCGVFNHEDGVEFWIDLDCSKTEEGLVTDDSNN